MTPDAIIQRLETSDQGTFGHFIAGRLAVFSGELSWRNNESNISCVPAGTYKAIFTNSPRFNRCLYLLAPTNPRGGIRIHPANFAGLPPLKKQLNGCVALGEKLGWMDGQKALLISAPAVRRVEEYFRGRPFTLEIRNAS